MQPFRTFIFGLRLQCSRTTFNSRRHCFSLPLFFCLLYLLFLVPFCLSLLHSVKNKLMLKDVKGVEMTITAYVVNECLTWFSQLFFETSDFRWILLDVYYKNYKNSIQIFFNIYHFDPTSKIFNVCFKLKLYPHPVFLLLISLKTIWHYADK